MLLDKLIYAPGVRIHRGSRFFVEKSSVAFGGRSESQQPELLVQRNRLRSYNFRKLSARHSSQHIHLEQPVLRHHIPLRFRHVRKRTRANVRNPPNIALNSHFFLQTRQGSRSIHLWQRSYQQPPRHSTNDGDQNSQDPTGNAQQDSQIISSKKM